MNTPIDNAIASQSETGSSHNIRRRSFLAILVTGILAGNLWYFLRFRHNPQKDVVAVNGPFINGERKKVSKINKSINFAKPIGITFKERGGIYSAHVDFEFIGTQQQLLLILEANNRYGEALAQKQLVCNRQQFDQKPVYISGYPLFSRETGNNENFRISLSGTIVDISQVQLSFLPL